MTKTLSQTPAAIAARARREQAKRIQYRILHGMFDPSIQGVTEEEYLAGKRAPAADLAPAVALKEEPGAGAFAALTKGLDAEPTQKAGKAAKVVVAKAQKAAKAAPVKPEEDRTAYVEGTYKGKAGAMFAFMTRIRDMVTREGGFKSVTKAQAIADMTGKAPHPDVSTRAQVLDYFAWAVRKGLLITVAVPVAKKGKAKATA